MKHFLMLLAVAATAGGMYAAAASGSHQSAVPKARLANRFLITAGRRSSLQGRLEIVGKDGHLIRLVSDRVAPFFPFLPPWLSPNRKLIAWWGKGGVHVENVDGSNARLLVKLDCPPIFQSNAGCRLPFVWSPDSRELLLVDANNGLAVASLATGALQEIVAPQQHVTYDPLAWSGPANQILFNADDHGEANGNGCCSEKLIIADPSGSSQRTLYTAAEPIHDGALASWSPNGRWISFTTDGWADPRLAIVTVSTGATKRVKHYNGYTEPPLWSPDSKHFALGYNKGIEIFTPAGKTTSHKPNKPNSAYPAAWTAGGIYVILGHHPRRLFVIPNGRRTARPVFTLPWGQALFAVQPL